MKIWKYILILLSLTSCTYIPSRPIYVNPYTSYGYYGSIYQPQPLYLYHRRYENFYAYPYLR